MNRESTWCSLHLNCGDRREPLVISEDRMTRKMRVKGGTGIWIAYGSEGKAGSPCENTGTHGQTPPPFQDLTMSILRGSQVERGHVSAGEEMSDSDRGDIEISTRLCKGCYLCIPACPPAVLTQSTLMNRQGYYAVSYKGSGCTGCGICFYVCPEPGVITVRVREREPAVVAS